jgi:hypothetical protein
VTAAAWLHVLVPAAFVLLAQGQGTSPAAAQARWGWFTVIDVDL